MKFGWIQSLFQPNLQRPWISNAVFHRKHQSTTRSSVDVHDILSENLEQPKHSSSDRRKEGQRKSKEKKTQEASAIMG